MSDCPSNVETPDGLREIARFLMVEEARVLSRDSIGCYLQEERPDLTDEQRHEAVDELRDLIYDATHTITWEDEAE